MAGASIFSGRKDPAWPVPAALGRELAELWRRLPPWSGERPHAPQLGYRGCRLAAPDGRAWAAFRELVTSGAETRRDEKQVFERTILASAPTGLLPPTFV